MRILGAVLAVCLVAGAVQAATLAEWTFETSVPLLNNSAASPDLVAEGGLFAATSIGNGLHASAGTDWSNPVGNGTAESFSSNEWAIGDYYQFQTSTVGYSGITITWDQTSSSTGPRDFDLQWSTDGLNFTTISSYAVLANASPPGNWSSTLYHPEYAFGPVAGPSALDNQATIYFRLTMTTDVAVNGLPVAATGTDRVDTVRIEGVPEPASLALMAIGGLALLRRR